MRIDRPRPFNFKSNNEPDNRGISLVDFQRFNLHREFEPIPSNRFIFTFPEDIIVPQYFVYSVTLPRCTQPIVGLQYQPIVWDDIIVELISTYENINSLYELVRNGIPEGNLLFKIELLNAVGGVIQSWGVSGYVSSIDFGYMSYGNSDELLTTQIVIKPVDCFPNR